MRVLGYDWGGLLTRLVSVCDLFGLDACEQLKLVGLSRWMERAPKNPPKKEREHESRRKTERRSREKVNARERKKVSK